MKFKIFLLAMSFYAQTSFTPYADPAKLVVWDVGQGQWVTFIRSETCDHFDVGGERFPAQVISHCGRKLNRLSLSHWDFDHIGLIFKAKRRGLIFCISHLPMGDHRIKPILSDWPKCEGDSRIYQPFGKFKNNNDKSTVFYLDQIKALITGDAPAKEERKLNGRLKLDQVQWLVVGHHGSKTSSDFNFLNRLRKVRVGLVSARYAKYRHPHPVVVSRFKKLKIPLISTEDWGDLMVVP